MVEVKWDPQQYHRYADLRLRPALELFDRISLDSPEDVHDIGTGGGEIARLMEQRWPAARVVATDSSAEMLATAKANTPAGSRIQWELLDLNDWAPAAEFDVIYGNAVLHWLPDHAETFPRLIGGLRPGGELAIQMPLSWYQPSHVAIRDTLAAFGTAEAGALAEFMATPNVALPEVYYEILHPIVSNLDIWITEYQQVLSGADPVFEFVKGSILRPVFTQLPEADAAEFAAQLKPRLAEAYPRRSDGSTLFRPRRIFIMARR
jgi:trans-aconitate 2-methyltransferase